MPGGIGLANPQFPYKSYFDPIGEAAPSPYIYDVTTKNQFALRSFKDNVGNCFTDMVLMSDGADSTSTFRLFTNTPEGNAVERMSIPSNGTIVHSTGTTVDSSYLNESPGFTTDHFIYTRAIVNEPETGTGPAAIVFGNGATYGTDEISLITGGNTRMYIRSNGNVGIGTTSPSYNMHVVGDIYATGNITGYSDRRAKSDIQKIENALEKIEKLNGYTFTMKNKRYTGLIAQEVLPVLPEAVVGTEETEYAIAYGNMLGLIVEGIKEIKKKLDM